MKYAIIHPGQAHRDEALALGIAYATNYLSTTASVYRREPTEEELDDPEVLVLDVGRRHEPELNNFDHHQLDRDAGECAMSLFARHRQCHDLLADRPWYQATIFIDTMGPYAMAARLGLSEFPKELMSPFDMAILDTMAKLNHVPGWVKDVLKTTMVLRMEEAQEMRLRAEWLDVNHTVQGLALIVEDDSPKGIEELRERLGQDIAISVTLDDRGAGWCLYRFDDDPRFDFSQLEGDPRILFAHANGFIAKTRERLPLDEVMNLAAAAIIS